MWRSTSATVAASARNLANYRLDQADSREVAKLPCRKTRPRDDELDGLGWQHHARHEEAFMAIAWFVIWFIANLIGGDEALKLDPVNAWTATLILALALDINRPGGWMGPPTGGRGGPPWKRSRES
jgi:hypothetical protein